ncbi:MAG: sensor domain-containing diguanylate cyclase [Ferrimonas sp.]
MEQQKSSIGRELLFSNLGFSFLLLVVIGCFNAQWLYNAKLDNAITALKQRNAAISSQFGEYLASSVHLVETLAQSPLIQQAGFDPQLKKEAIERYSYIQSASRSNMLVFSGYDNGALLIYAYPLPEYSDSRTRDWYQQAIATPNAVITTMPYLDLASEAWMVAIAKQFRNAEGRQGVVATSLGMKKVNFALQNNTGYDSIHSTIVHSDGTLIFDEHGNIGTRLNPELQKFIQLNQPAEHFTYWDEDRYEIAYITAVPHSDWLVLTTVDRQEVTSPIIQNVAQNLLIILALAIVLALLQGTLLSHRIVLPMQLLKSRVAAVLTGKPQPEGNFPANEIGLIAKQVLQLTSKELYQKSHQLQQAYDSLALVHKQLADKNTSLTKIISQDTLTCGLNREVLKQFINSHLLADVPWVLMGFDIDKFKQIHDTYGYIEAERLLQDVACVVAEHIESNGVFGRWSDEEFMLLLPNTLVADAQDFAQQLLTTVMQHQYALGQAISVNWVMLQGNEFDNIHQILQAANNGSQAASFVATP